MDWSFLHSDTSSLARVISQPGLDVHFTLDGIPLSGVRSMVKREARNTDLGLVDGDYQFSLVVRGALLSREDVKPRRSKAVIDGTEYRVLYAEWGSGDSVCTLHLGSVSQ